MNPLKLIYSSLYYDFKKRGNTDNARANGTLVSTISIFLLLFSGFLLSIIYITNFEQKATQFLIYIFNDKTVVKGLSQLFLVLAFAIIYIIIKYTIGTENAYHKTIEEFNLLTIEQQKRIKKRANPYIITPMILFIITMIILMNK